MSSESELMTELVARTGCSEEEIRRLAIEHVETLIDLQTEDPDPERTPLSIEEMRESIQICPLSLISRDGSLDSLINDVTIEKEHREERMRILQSIQSSRENVKIRKGRYHLCAFGDVMIQPFVDIETKDGRRYMSTYHTPEEMLNLSQEVKFCPPIDGGVLVYSDGQQIGEDRYPGKFIRDTSPEKVPTMLFLCNAFTKLWCETEGNLTPLTLDLINDFKQAEMMRFLAEGASIERMKKILWEKEGKEWIIEIEGTRLRFGLE